MFISVPFSTDERISIVPPNEETRVRMLSDGKFITYGITFDVGNSTIKPESMGEISRIVQLMNEKPDLKFSVEGHTDSTGNATSNQTLSEACSQVIVAKLIEMGIFRRQPDILRQRTE